MSTSLEAAYEELDRRMKAKLKALGIKRKRAEEKLDVVVAEETATFACWHTEAAALEAKARERIL